MQSLLNTKSSKIFSFCDDFTGVDEYQIIFHAKKNLPFEQQFKDITDQYEKFCSEFSSDTKPIFKRYFLSDAANQQHLVKDYELSSECAISIIQQPPLDGSKIALFVWFQTNVDVKKDADINIVSSSNYNHYWIGGYSIDLFDSDYQSNRIFEKYDSMLLKHNCSTEKNCVRTWLFVQNVDVNYAGVVKGRKDYFDKINLTKDTHYISSTGIEGRVANPASLVIFDAYAVSDLKDEQIQFLYAPQYLNPTYEYGVTFERGTAIHYGDRTHVFISGTASINNKGEIVHPGNIEKQIERTWQNVEALLSEADCKLNNIASLIVYLRDIADYELTHKMFNEKFPDKPMIIVLAPVCRPGWLIEMECIAIRRNNNRDFRNY